MRLEPLKSTRVRDDAPYSEGVVDSENSDSWMLLPSE